jgi:hypothetical protein
MRPILKGAIAPGVDRMACGRGSHDPGQRMTLRIGLTHSSYRSDGAEIAGGRSSARVAPLGGQHEVATSAKTQ